MLPSAYEFHWDLGHMVFLGIFYGVVTVVLSVLGYAAYCSWRDLRQRRAAALECEELFEELPPERRVCRHSFIKGIEGRVCENCFDCAHCQVHQEALRSQEISHPVTPHTPDTASTEERLFHRGHSWAERQPDGSYTVGMDTFLGLCLGPIEQIQLPPIGQDVQSGEHCLSVKRGNLKVRIAAPITGKVMAHGDGQEDWLYTLQPASEHPETEHLLHGAEAKQWLLRETDWLHGVLSPAALATTLADGGTPVADLVQAYPQADWDGIWGLVCMDV